MKENNPEAHFDEHGTTEYFEPRGDPSCVETNSDSGVGLEDFVAYMPQHCYIFKPTRETWPASSVNARVPLVVVDGTGRPTLDEAGKQKFQSASAWLDQNRAVEQMTWMPGDPMLIRGGSSRKAAGSRGRAATSTCIGRRSIAPGDAAQAAAGGSTTSFKVYGRRRSAHH